MIEDGKDGSDNETLVMVNFLSSNSEQVTKFNVLVDECDSNMSKSSNESDISFAINDTEKNCVVKVVSLGVEDKLFDYSSQSENSTWTKDSEHKITSSDGAYLLTLKVDANFLSSLKNKNTISIIFSFTHI